MSGRPISEASQVFFEDVREKKRIGHGSIKKGGRMRTAFDLLTKKEQRTYMQNSEVKISVELPDTYAEYKALPVEHQKKVLQYIFESFDGVYGKDFQKKLLEKWKLSNTGPLFTFARKYGIIPEKQKKQPKKMGRPRKNPLDETPSIEIESSTLPDPATIETPQPEADPQQPILSVLTEMMNRLTRLEQLIEQNAIEQQQRQMLPPHNPYGYNPVPTNSTDQLAQFAARIIADLNKR